jgi:hypothetical protein
MVEQVKAMGMAEMTFLSDEATGKTLMVYPGLQAYTDMSGADAKPADDSKIKVSVTPLGKETVEGRACAKNKVVVTDADGTANEATVWNATDLKDFPVRIDTGDGNTKVKMTFKGVKFEAPNPALFEPPAKFKRYDNLQAMLQDAVMKQLLGGQKAK